MTAGAALLRWALLLGVLSFYAKGGDLMALLRVTGAWVEVGDVAGEGGGPTPWVDPSVRGDPAELPVFLVRPGRPAASAAASDERFVSARARVAVPRPRGRRVLTLGWAELVVFSVGVFLAGYLTCRVVGRFWPAEGASAGLGLGLGAPPGAGGGEPGAESGGAP